MAELLIWTGSNKIDLTLSSERSGALLKRGDIRVVRPNGSPWGNRERKSIWIAEGNDPADWFGTCSLLLVTGLSVVDGRKLLGQEHRVSVEGDPEFEEETEGGRRELVHHHKWRFNLREFGVAHAARRAQLATDGEVTMGRVLFQQFCDHKATRVQFSRTDPDGFGQAKAGRSGWDDS